MGFFDRDLFDFNGDGKTDGFETYVRLLISEMIRILWLQSPEDLLDCITDMKKSRRIGLW